jgi:nucleoside-diphosphate-sugar epimerase
MTFQDKGSIVLVTGATGAVGPRVVHVLDQAGFQIRSLSVDAPAPAMFPQGVEILIGDVTDQVAVQSAMRGVDAVVHMAALLHMTNPPCALQGKYERINVGGTATVVAAAVEACVKRVVFFSTIAVYGASNGQIITESMPPNPDTFYARTKLAAEQIVLEATGSDGKQIGTVLRLSAVYGSKVKGNYKQLVQSLARGRFMPVGKGRNRRTLVYDKDVARAAVTALEHPAAAGKIYNVSDGEYHTLNHIISIMCQALGRKPPRISLPIAAVRFASGVVEDMARKLGIKPPIVRATIDKYLEDVAVDSRLIRKELGFLPQYDLLTGWKDAIQEMRRSGDL